MVFDTNIVVSALVFGGRLAWLRQAWATSIRPIVCRETVDELLRVLAYPKFRLGRAEQAMLLEDYLPFADIATMPDPAPALPMLCRDRDDVVFIGLALACAFPLVLGDKDVTSLRLVAPVPIFSVAELSASVSGLDANIKTPHA